MAASAQFLLKDCDHGTGRKIAMINRLPRHARLTSLVSAADVGATSTHKVEVLHQGHTRIRSRRHHGTLTNKN